MADPSILRSASQAAHGVGYAISVAAEAKELEVLAAVVLEVSEGRKRFAIVAGVRQRRRAKARKGSFPFVVVGAGYAHGWLVGMGCDWAAQRGWQSFPFLAVQIHGVGKPQLALKSLTLGLLPLDLTLAPEKLDFGVQSGGFFLKGARLFGNRRVRVRRCFGNKPLRTAAALLVSLSPQGV